MKFNIGELTVYVYRHNDRLLKDIDIYCDDGNELFTNIDDLKRIIKEYEKRNKE